MKPIQVGIKDFQSIDSLDLEISGFTCVTGPTNIGKSAIIRAVSSAILNRSVVGSVRKGKKHCTVEVDGLRWEKGERVGRYWVPGEVDEGGNPRPRDGIGQGQTEVTERMGFRSVKVGDKYINPWLATQFDPIFLMQDSGPAVTDFISDITHLKVLQDAIVHCTLARSRLLAAAKEKEEDLRALTAKEAALGGLDNLLRAEKDLVQQMESVEEYGRSIARLRHLISSMDREGRVISFILPAKEVRVPRAPTDPAAALLPMAKLWSDIEAAALRVSPVKGAIKVTVPDPPDTESVESLRRTARFLAIPSLTASVSALSGSEGTMVPAMPDDGLPRLLRAARIGREADRARASLSVLEREIPSVPDAPQLSGLSRAAATYAQVRSTEASVAALESQAESVSAELAAVEEEISRIPRCPTCKQVFVRGHAHA